MQKYPVTLSVSHNIFLEKDERYSLHNGDRLVVIGSSLPVWFYRGATSEPAEEVFCKYILTNDKTKKVSVKRTKTGYKINLPQIPEGFVSPILGDDEWRKLTEKQRSDWYNKYKMPIGSWKLLDYKDGGGKALNFKTTETNDFSKETRNPLLEITNIIHIVIIKDYDDLQSSLTSSL